MAAGALKSVGRYLSITSFGILGIFLLVECVAWCVAPSRYRNPPAVTADAWVHSDALAPGDSVWLTEFVEEFCLSYTARWTPYVYFRRTPFAGRHINVDSSGLRYTPQFRERGAPPAKKIFLLGGSAMWGTGARDSATIPASLARQLTLDRSLPPALVVNMGESGYVSTQDILTLELELRKGNIPDIVILYDGVNDIFSAYQNSAAGQPQNEMHRAMEFNLLKEGGRMRALGIADMWKRTFTAELLDSLRSLIRPAPPAAPSAPGLASAVVKVYVANLEIVQALSRQYGFRYLAYWQPVVFTKSDPSPYERRQADLLHYVRPLFLETYRLLAADPQLRANSSFHDLGGVLDGGPAYIDFCHVTERANASIARRMYGDLRPFLNPSP